MFCKLQFTCNYLCFFPLEFVVLLCYMWCNVILRVSVNWQYIYVLVMLRVKVASCFAYVYSTTFTRNLAQHTFHFLLIRLPFHLHNFLSCGGLGLEDCSDAQWPAHLFNLFPESLAVRYSRQDLWLFFPFHQGSWNRRLSVFVWYSVY